MPAAPVYLAQSIMQGVGNIGQLKARIAKTEGIDRIAAFGLAQFVLDYGDFIAPDPSHDIMTD